MNDDPALVFEAAPAGGTPGTHVLIIGVGTYDYLLGGALANEEVADSMGQLPSASASARALADWFLDGYDNCERPLASLALVLSEREPATYAHPKATIPGRSLPNGEMATVSDAVDAWIDRASGVAGDMVVLYFVGHGIWAGNSLLLCRDYGASRKRRFEKAINLDDLLVGLATMPPDLQLVLVDACRSPDKVANLVTSAKASYGNGILTPRDAEERFGTEALQSVHFATSSFTPAWARPDTVSLYSEALIKALSGGGAQLRLHWWVGTGGLQDALLAYVPRLAAEAGVKQEPDRLRSAQFSLTKPAKFDIPVYVTCVPLAVYSQSFRLSATGAGRLEEHAHDPRERAGATHWTLALPKSSYTFRIGFDGVGDYEDLEFDEVVVPPEVPISLEPRRRTAG